jgi:hypothetical protein
MGNNWKQFRQGSEIPVTLSFIWTLIKKWVKKEPYHMTISFHYKEGGDTKLTGAQIEFGKGFR